MTTKDFRKKIAVGEFCSPTAGYCTGHVQTNMVVLPKNMQMILKSLHDLTIKLYLY